MNFAKILISLIACIGVFGFGSVAMADDDLDCQVVAKAVNPTEAGATDDYINLTDGSISATVTAQDEFTVSVDMIGHSLRVDVNAVASVNDIWLISVVDDSVVTLLSCSITGTSALSCADDSFIGHHEFEAGSDITVLIDSSTGTGDPATAAEMRVSFCLSRVR